MYCDKPTPPKELMDFPGLSQDDLDTVERRFNQYLFFENEKTGRRIWTTCCHRQEFIEEWGRTSSPADRLVLAAGHNEYTTCPYCGRVVRAKNRKLLKRGVKLTEYYGVVFLHVSEDGDTVWAQGYWATRDLMGDPAGPVLYLATRVYRFQPGKAEQWDIYYHGEIHKRKHPKLLEPCVENVVEPYTPIGLSRLENSFLKYTMYGEPMPQDRWGCRLWEERGVRDDLIRYLAAASRFPRQVELMRKARLDEALGDLVWAWKKNADVLKWNETDPCKAFGLTKPELKEFLAGEKCMDTLRVLKGVRKLGGKITVAQADKLRGRLPMMAIKNVLNRAKTFNVPVNALLRYLDGFTGPRCHGQGVTLGFVTGFWVDYIDMADRLGYDLSNPVWQMPKNLEEKHDQLAEVVNAMKMEAAREQMEKRREKAGKRYNFTMDGWIIRAPMDADEIRAEGAALKHCVGGYAARHIEGKRTILFLRSEAAPDTPYVTIEMNGSTLVQIHGYDNERSPCAVNPKRTPPRETHRKLIDTWLEWVKKGSRRHKDGTPVLPRKNNKKEKVE